MQPTSGTSWARAGAGFTVTRIVGQGMEFLGFVVLARQLGSEAFGAFWLAFLVARYLAVIGDWGANMRGARDVAGQADPAQLAALVRRRVQVSVALAATFVGALVLANRPGLAVLAACIISRGTNRDWMRLGAAKGLSAGMPSVIQGVVLLLLVLTVETSTQASLATATAYLVGLAASLRLNRLPRRAPGQTHPPVDGWLLTGALADQVSLTADSLLLGSLVSVKSAGIYGAVYRLPNAASTVLGLVVVVTTARLAANLSLSADGGRKDLRRSLIVSAAVAVGLACLAPLARALVVPVFGEQYRSGQTAAAVLFVALAVVCAGAPLHASALAARQDRAYALGLLGAAVVNLSVNLLLIPRFELSGAAVATLISTTSLLVYLSLLTRHRHLAAEEPVSE